MTEQIKVRELISRATYKTVKNMNREQMNNTQCGTARRPPCLP